MCQGHVNSVIHWCAVAIECESDIDIIIIVIKNSVGDTSMVDPGFRK